MTLAIVYSRANAGIASPLVTVEVHLSRGLPKLNIVGLPETAVKESKDRVRSALLNTFFEFPRRRITVNLAPADLPKEGGCFDLPIALGILAASEQIPKDKLDKFEFSGELALSGELRSVRGVLPMVLASNQAKRTLIIPFANSQEAAIVQEADVFSANHLLEVCAYLKNEINLPICVVEPKKTDKLFDLDLADVRGQFHAKRALEIAAAGKHSILFLGAPGTGKTMLANRLTSILPPLDDNDSLEVAAIASVSHKGFDFRQWQVLPFRSPHHSSSVGALVGGGRPPRPGEISLAHRGVLFLDELPEFHRSALESLREPLESGQITISRAAYQTTFPAQFQLVAAMNPCPCGYAGSTKGNCHCTSEQIYRYMNKISGPLLDRIDMQVEVATVPPEILASTTLDRCEQSSVVKKRVLRSRAYQLKRQGKSNMELKADEVLIHCPVQEEGEAILNQMMNKYHFSARSYHRILKIARTIADLEENELILTSHISEAFTYRCLDRFKINH